MIDNCKKKEIALISMRRKGQNLKHTHLVP